MLGTVQELHLGQVPFGISPWMLRGASSFDLILVASRVLTSYSWLREKEFELGPTPRVYLFCIGPLGPLWRLPCLQDGPCPLTLRWRSLREGACSAAFSGAAKKGSGRPTSSVAAVGEVAGQKANRSKTIRAAGGAMLEVAVVWAGASVLRMNTAEPHHIHFVSLRWGSARGGRGGATANQGRALVVRQRRHSRAARSRRLAVPHCSSSRRASAACCGPSRSSP